MSSPSTSPAKGKSWIRSVRRASSLLVPAAITRSSTPSDRDSDTASLKRTPSIPSLIPPKPVVSHPSPIAESPARENAAVQDAIPQPPAVEPSPLAQAPVTVSPEPAAPTPDVIPEITQTSPQEYTHPPLIDSTAVAGPGAFLDDVDELPQPHAIVDPSREPSILQADSTDGHGPAPQLGGSHFADSPRSVAATLPVTPPPERAHTGAFFDNPVHDEPLSLEEGEDLAAAPAAAPKNVATDEDHDVFGPVAVPVQALQDAAPVPVAQEPTVIEEPQVPAAGDPVPEPPRGIPSKILTPAVQPAVLPVDYDEPQPAPPMPIPHPATPAPEPAVVLPPTPPAYPLPLPSFEYHPGQEVWGGLAAGAVGAAVGAAVGVAASQHLANGNASTRSRSSSIRMPFHDPFADPVEPRLIVSQPVPEPYHVDEPEGPLDTHSRGIVMPLPPVHQVIPERSLRAFPSTQSLLASNGGGGFEANERLPLLSRQGSPKGFYYLQPSRSAVNVSAAPSTAPPASTWPGQATTATPRLHDLGWIEYHLPDGTLYYVHPTRRVTANIDLRNDTKLDALTAYFEAQAHTDSAGAPAGIELWLREDEARRAHEVFRPVRFWVNHLQRAVTRDQPNAVNGNGAAAAAGKKKNKKNTVVEDDQLDAEYRYWAFVEAHPAHAALSPNARVEATDVLTWAWTDSLLPSHRNVPAPFTQEECQELTRLLRSFEQSENGPQTVVHTRIIARILLRIAQWRQQHFRPNKPLPTDVGSHNLGLPRYRRPFGRALVDLVISCLCLGIPYIFFERGRHLRLDEESGVRGRPGPMFLVSACTCLVAAIVLSASVTFLSLPGLDSFARVAGFVTILFATFSMASTVVALFRYKADLGSPVSHVAGEGLLMLSKRSVVLSLPLVFLIYAIIAFATGIVLYSFRGVGDPLSSEHRFEDYTRWTVVGVLGGLAGMLTTSLLLLR